METFDMASLDRSNRLDRIALIAAKLRDFDSHHNIADCDEIEEITRLLNSDFSLECDAAALVVSNLSHLVRRKNFQKLAVKWTYKSYKNVDLMTVFIYKYLNNLSKLDIVLRHFVKSMIWSYRFKSESLKDIGHYCYIIVDSARMFREMNEAKDFHDILCYSVMPMIYLPDFRSVVRNNIDVFANFEFASDPIDNHSIEKLLSDVVESLNLR